MAADARKREEFNLQISYSQEYVEEERPNGDMVYPVISPDSFRKVNISASKRALVFLTILTIVCLGALVLAPIPIVQGAAAMIWLGSLKIVQQILKNVNRQSK